MSDCIGITYARKLCNRNLDEDDESPFCPSHKYQENFGKKTLTSILNGTNTEYKLGAKGCNHWHNGPMSYCQPCTVKRKDNQHKKAEEKKKKGCPAFVDPEKTNVCLLPRFNGTSYCKKHGYLTDFTKEMLENSKVCTIPTCHKTFYDANNPEAKTCQECRERGKKNREKIAKADTRKMCATVGCKRHENLKLGNGYCGKCNNSQIAKKNILASGKKICSRWHHHVGCKESLEKDDPFDTCIVCRTGEQTADMIKRQNIKAKASVIDKQNTEELKKVKVLRNQKYQTNKLTNRIDLMSVFLKNDDNSVNYDNSDSDDYFVENESTDSESVDETKIMKMCTRKGCCKMFDLTHFVGPHGEITAECQNCRDKNKVAVVGRVRKPCNVDLVKLKEKQKRRREYRANNKVLMATRDKYYRLVAQEKVGVDEYHKKKAEEAKAYRKRNMKKMDFYNELRNKNIDYRLYFYKKRAEGCNIDWFLTDSDALNFFKGNCHYCGEMDLNEMNGIDRLNNGSCYRDGNVVPCCKICNFMKGEFEYPVYLNIVKHIMAYIMDLIGGYECDNLFENHCSATIEEYKKRAGKKEPPLPFKLTEFDFCVMRTVNCYLCGRITDDIHINGVDRIDNTKGYTLDNCLPCCGTCNMIKNDFDIFDVCRKMYKTVCKFNKLPEENYNADELKEFVRTHITVEQERLKNAIAGFKSLDKDNDQKPKKVIKVKDKNVLKKDQSDIIIIKQEDLLNVFDFENSDSEDENPKKVIIPKKAKNINDIADKIVFDEINDINSDADNDVVDNRKLKRDKQDKEIKDRISKAVVAAKERIGDSKEFSLNDVTLKDAGINENTVKNKIKKENSIKKYGEDGHKKIEALRKDRQRATKNGDTNKVEQIEQEINNIRNMAIKPGKKVKLTEDEKRENERLRKARNRQKEKEKFGKKAIQERWRIEKNEQRNKNKGEESD